MQLIYRMFMWAHRLVVVVLGWRYRFEGVERLPRHGGVVLAVNHISYFDPVVVACAALQRKRQLRFLAKAELFDIPVWGWLMHRQGMIPVDRHGSPTGVLDTAVEALVRGDAVVVFPESTITLSFVPAELRTGAARMAQRAGVPLLPVAVWGPHRIATKGRPLRWQRGVTFSVHVGEPVPAPADATPAAVTADLEMALRALVETAATTYPQQPGGDDDRWWLPAHLGGTAPTEAEAARQRREERARKRRAAQERRDGDERSSS